MAEFYTLRFHDMAMRFIQARMEEEKPFFLYLAYNAPLACMPKPTTWPNMKAVSQGVACHHGGRLEAASHGVDHPSWEAAPREALQDSLDEETRHLWICAWPPTLLA